MFTLAFWKAAIERAVKTAAQALLSAGIIGATPLLDIDWKGALSVAALAALGSILTSIISSGVGGAGPSLGTETLTGTVAAEERPESDELVAGPASDLPRGVPVDVVPSEDASLGDSLGDAVSGVADGVYGSDPKTDATYNGRHE